MTRNRSVAGWLLLALALFVAAIGAILAVGGVWLAALGGSWYYAVAGSAMVVTGWLLARDQFSGVILYFTILGLTVLWSLWEVGLDGWALLPRLGGPVALAVALILLIPTIRRRAALRGKGERAAPSVAAAQLESGIALFITIGAVLFALTGAWFSAASVVLAQTASQKLPGGEAQTVSAAASPAAAISEADWPAYGRGNTATRYSPLDQLTPETVGELERVWSYRTGDLPEDKVAAAAYAPETTPLKVGETLYLCTPLSVAIALDAATGREIWRHDAETSIDAAPYTAACRGVAYYLDRAAQADAVCAARVLMGTLDGRLIALDSRDGRPCAGFGTDGTIDLKTDLGPDADVPGFVAVTSPPTIVNGVAVIGHLVLDGQKEDAPSGVVRGYDAVSGALVWAWDLGRAETQGPAAQGESYTPGTPNAWTIFSADDALGLVYLPLGNSAVDYFGGARTPEEERFGSAMVALDAATGALRWSFQTVHHDVWDYDLSSQGSLIDFPADEGPVPAIIFATKTGDIYVLDRRTGAPLTEVEEKPAPQGGVAGERLAPTQPHSVGFPHVRPERLTERDAWGVSAIDQLWCRIQFRQASYEGMYTPPTVDKPWINFPGNNGGVDWGGLAVDEARGILVVNWNSLPMMNRLISRDEANRLGLKTIDEGGDKEDDPQAGSPYGLLVKFWRSPLGPPCVRPPWGGLMAVDLKTRKVLWRKPFGTAYDNGILGVPSRLPIPIGVPNNGGAAVTAGGVTFVGATTDRYLRAIETGTGKVLWKARLPAGGQATPITYEADGRQFILIMAGGHAKMETKIGDHVIAYALPQRQGDL